MLTKKEVARIKRAAARLAKAEVEYAFRGAGDPSFIDGIELELKKAKANVNAVLKSLTVVEVDQKDPRGLSNITYILVTAEKVKEKGDDTFDLVSDYEVFDLGEFENAQEAYRKAVEDDDVYSATLAAVIDSSDYDTHPEVRLYSRG